MKYFMVQGASVGGMIAVTLCSGTLPSLFGSANLIFTTQTVREHKCKWISEPHLLQGQIQLRL